MVDFLRGEDVTYSLRTQMRRSKLMLRKKLVDADPHHFIQALLVELTM
jgi:hypothetical protein